MLRYSLMRLLLFIAVFLTLWLLGTFVPGLRNPWLLLALTAVVSAALSWFTLRGPRAEAALLVERRLNERTTRRRATQGPTDEEVEDASPGPAATRRDDFV